MLVYLPCMDGDCCDDEIPVGLPYIVTTTKGSGRILIIGDTNVISISGGTNPCTHSGNTAWWDNVAAWIGAGTIAAYDDLSEWSNHPLSPSVLWQNTFTLSDCVALLVGMPPTGAHCGFTIAYPSASAVASFVTSGGVLIIHGEHQSCIDIPTLNAWMASVAVGASFREHTGIDCVCGAANNVGQAEATHELNDGTHGSTISTVTHTCVSVIDGGDPVAYTVEGLVESPCCTDGFGNPIYLPERHSLGIFALTSEPNIEYQTSGQIVYDGTRWYGENVLTKHSTVGACPDYSLHFALECRPGATIFDPPVWWIILTDDDGYLLEIEVDAADCSPFYLDISASVKFGNCFGTKSVLLVVAS